MSKLETQTFQDLLAFTLSSEYCKFARKRAQYNEQFLV